VLLLQSQLLLLAGQPDEAAVRVQSAQAAGGAVRHWEESVVAYCRCRLGSRDGGERDALAALEGGVEVLAAVARWVMRVGAVHVNAGVLGARDGTCCCAGAAGHGSGSALWGPPARQPHRRWMALTHLGRRLSNMSRNSCRHLQIDVGASCTQTRVAAFSTA
jgi:hypothetical protein